MEYKPSVAIIILNWNGFDDTRACLNSLRQATYTNHKVILVDNGSTDNEGARLQEMFPEIELISNATNRGFAGGCNDGINRALESGFDYIMTLNNDTLVDGLCLTNLIAGVQAAHADFGSARIMCYPETDLICSDGDALLPDGTGYAVNALKKYTESEEHAYIFSACGAGAIFSRKCLDTVRIQGNQFFDELFFAYFEDIDLGARLQALGYTGVTIPHAVIYHKESKAAGQRSFFKIYQSEKNRILVELLNFPLWLIAVGELYYSLRTLARCLAALFIKSPPHGNRSLPEKKFSPWGVLLKSRRWILLHLAAIYRDRQERKHKGMLNRKIYQYLCWEMKLF